MLRNIQPIDTLCEQNSEMLKLKAGGIYIITTVLKF
jgi:hypothetical protein